MRPIDKIIIHCTATEEGNDYSVQEIRGWHLYRGFSDIGYHFVIHPNGVVEIGRPLNRVGSHCKGHNSKSIGIAYIGGLRNGKPCDTRTEYQRESLKDLVECLVSEYGCTVHGHNEFSDKSCPCFDVSKEFENDYIGY